MHILYIDDDLVDRMAFQRLVRKSPAFTCDCVASIEASKEAIEDSDYQLIVTDHNLSDGTAYDVLKATTLPIVVTSGVVDSNTLSSFQKAGALAFLLKPITEVELKEAISPLSQSTNSHLPFEEIFDLTYLKELSDGDAAFEAEMISIYLDEVPASLEKLRGEMNQAQWKLAAKTVHKLLSKIRIMGLHDGLQLAESIEQTFKSGEANPEVLQKANTLILSLQSSLASALLLKSQLENLPKTI